MATKPKRNSANPKKAQLGGLLGGILGGGSKKTGGNVPKNCNGGKSKKRK